MSRCFLPRTVWVVVLASLLTTGAVAAPLRNVPVPDVQPDGTRIDLWVTGDEAYRHVTDARGFTVLRDPVSGWRVYADLRQGQLVPTGLAVGLDDPVVAGLVPGVRAPFVEDAAVPRSRATPMTFRKAPTTGLVYNLLVFVRFQDDDLLEEAFADYERQFESLDPGVPSMRAFFRENSLGALDVRTLFLPTPEDTQVVAFTVPHSRAYYRVYERIGNPDGYTTESEGQRREQELWQLVLAGVADQVPQDVNLDADGDGWVDNVIFMVQGWPDAWADVLWPHKWELWDPFQLGGGKVGVFNLQFTTLMILSPGTFAHEMMHSLGAPDLYHYSQDGLSPVGPWDPMESTAAEPQHFLSYMKWRYGGWIPEIPRVDAGGEIELHPSWETGTQAVRVQVPESTSQHFILEYRRKNGTFESALPGSGLIAYRVDTRRDGVGNRNGPPDEVYVLRPGGSPEQNGSIGRAFLSAQSGRTNLSAWGQIRPVLTDGTDVTLRVYDVGEAGDTIRFKLCLEVPDCGERVCGDDGCGGQCGVCDQGNRCRADDGQCEPCSCEGRVCDDDGCGASCGSCDDSNACTSDSCVDFACEFQHLPAGAPCDDGDAATVDDACDGEGGCQGVVPPAPEPEPEPVLDAALGDESGLPDPGDAQGREDGAGESLADAPGDLTGDAAASGDVPGARATSGGCASGAGAGGGVLGAVLVFVLAVAWGVRRRGVRTGDQPFMLRM